MSDERLNDLLVLNVEKEEVNNINLEEAVDIFSNILLFQFKLKYF